jgi:hypothetical protein
VTPVIAAGRTEWHLGRTELAGPFVTGLATSFREFFEMSALRHRVQTLSMYVPASVGTYFARAALAGFAVWLLAMASHT